LPNKQFQYFLSLPQLPHIGVVFEKGGKEGGEKSVAKGFEQAATLSLAPRLLLLCALTIVGLAEGGEGEERERQQRQIPVCYPDLGYLARRAVW